MASLCLWHSSAKKAMWQLPHPGTFVIDADGIIRAKLFHSVVKRHTPAELVKAAEQIK